MASLSVFNGLVVTPDGVVPGGLASEDGVIVAIGEVPSLPASDVEIDARGGVIFPGVIDPHFHLGTGGSADDAKFLQDLVTETRSAARGGVTTIVTDHENAHGQSWITTSRRRDGTPLLHLAKEAISPRSPVDVRYTGNPCRPADLDDVPSLVEASVTSFKMFPSYTGEAAEEFGITTVDMAFIFQVLEVVGRLDSPARPTQAMVHCEEPGVCDVLKSRYRAEHDTLEWWTRSRPDVCEAMQIFDVGMLAREARGRVYIPHVSSAEGVRTIEYLKRRGADIVGETCPHYLLADFPWEVGARGKVNPPVRGRRDVAAMWRALRRGSISVLGSDNCRFTPEEKAGKSLWDAIPGFSEAFASLPLMLTHGIAEGRIDWPTLAAVMAGNPARCFAMSPQKGELRLGSDADFVVVDPEERWVFGPSELPPEAEASIYEGRTMIGRPRLTVRRGDVIAEGGWVAEGGGHYVESAPSPAR